MIRFCQWYRNISNKRVSIIALESRTLRETMHSFIRMQLLSLNFKLKTWETRNSNHFRRGQLLRKNLRQPRGDLVRDFSWQRENPTFHFEERCKAPVKGWKWSTCRNPSWRSSFVYRPRYPCTIWTLDSDRTTSRSPVSSPWYFSQEYQRRTRGRRETVRDDRCFDISGSEFRVVRRMLRILEYLPNIFLPTVT